MGTLVQRTNIGDGIVAAKGKGIDELICGRGVVLPVVVVISKKYVGARRVYVDINAICFCTKPSSKSANTRAVGLCLTDRKGNTVRQTAQEGGAVKLPLLEKKHSGEQGHNGYDCKKLDNGKTSTRTRA